jgi:putative endonuclease
MGGVDRRAFGQAGEDGAVAYLVAQGFRIRARNFTCPYGELDIVAEKDDLLCFVEVRMRSHAAWGDPAHTIGHRKQRRVVKAALHYLFAHAPGERMIRFDVVTVLGRGERAVIDHIVNAFDAGM